MFVYGEPIRKMRAAFLIEKGNAAADSNEFDKALSYYNGAWKYDPDNYQVVVGFVHALVGKGMFGDALRYCNKAMSIRHHELLDIFLFVIYENLIDEVAARKAFDRALPRFKGGPASLYNRIGYTYYTLGMYDRAESACRKAIDAAPDAYQPHANLARIHIAQERFKEGREELQKMLECNPPRRFKKRSLSAIKQIDARLSQER